MLAIDESASSFCAREMRGTLSIASTVAFLAASCCRSSGFCAGQMKLTSVPPSRSSATSSLPGARTLKTMSDIAQSRGGVVDDFGPGGTVGVVADLGRVAGTRFDGNPEALLDQLLDDLGHGGDPFLAGKALAWDSDQQ